MATYTRFMTSKEGFIHELEPAGCLDHSELQTEILKEFLNVN